MRQEENALAFLPPYRFRLARNEDAQDLFGLITLCFALYPGCFTDPHGDLPDLRAAGEWPLLRAADGRALGGVFVVAEDPSGRVCACAALDFPEAGTGEVHRVYVRPDCRQRGLAGALVAHLEGAARKAGAQRVVLWSDTRFADAHRFYEKRGYTRGQIRELQDISASREYYFWTSL